jgi:hypothetical protein
MFKRLASILILAAFLFTICGYYPVFKVQQSRIRREIKNLIKGNIPESELHLLSFTEKGAAQIKWAKEGKEFHYQNHLYDIVKYKKENGSVVYFCINDTEEEQLFANLDNLVKNQMDTGHDGGKTIKNILKTALSLVYVPSEKIALQLRNPSDLERRSCSIFYSSDFSEKIKQPPKFYI